MKLLNKIWGIPQERNVKEKSLKVINVKVKEKTTPFSSPDCSGNPDIVSK